MKIIKDYQNKAKKVNTKYISSPISTDFACVYVPSESLYLELNTHITENKELWVSEIQRKHKVTFMGPSTFAVYCSAILLGFNAISADKRSQNFLKHLDKFKKLLLDNYKLAEAQENKANLVYKSSTEVLRSAEKLKIEMEKVDEELQEEESKDEEMKKTEDKVMKDENSEWKKEDISKVKDENSDQIKEDNEDSKEEGSNRIKKEEKTWSKRWLKRKKETIEGRRKIGKEDEDKE